MLEKELIIQERFNQLRQTFHDIIYQQFHIQPPKDLLNRYLMIKLNDIQCDIKDILSKDLAMSIPVRLQQNYDRYDENKLQQIYQKNFTRINQNIRYLIRNATEQQKQLIRQFSSEISAISPYVVNSQQQSNQSQQSQLVIKANKLTKLAIQFNMQFYNSKFNDVFNQLEKKFQQLCSYIPQNKQSASLSDIKLHDQQQIEITDITQLKPQQKYFSSYKNEKIEISAENVFKLYDKVQGDFQEFRQHLFVMLFRYQSYQGNTWKSSTSQYVNKSEGINLQARVYQKLMNKLNEKFDVRTEMFASPVNCTFEQYFSQFEDVDKYFKSLGSCFNLKQNGQQLDDIIECNPPFTEEMLIEGANLVIQLLQQNRTKVVIFVCPSWREDCAKYHLILDDCKYKYANIQLQPNSYRYSCGGVGNDQGSFAGTFSSEYYVLCNENNKEKAKQIETCLRNFEHQYH